MKKYTVRGIFYVIGLLVLAFGISLNTKAGFGVSPIVSIAFAVSEIFDRNYGNMTLVLYCLFVLIEILLHLICSRRGDAKLSNLKLVLIFDVLQIPLSVVFTRFMNLYMALIPDFYELEGWAGSIPLRLLVLLLAVVCTGVGATMTLNMRIVPNPGDGIVQAVSDTIRRSLGFTKNCFDLSCVCVTAIIGFACAGRIVGIGIGTLVAVLGVGRTIAVFNHFFLKKMTEAAGLQ